MENGVPFSVLRGDETFVLYSSSAGGIMRRFPVLGGGGVYGQLISKSSAFLVDGFSISSAHGQMRQLKRRL